MTLNDTVSNVSVKKDTLVDFQIKEGLRQNDPLSILQFNILLEKIVRGILVNRDGHILRKSHQVVGYADDMGLIVMSENELKEVMLRLIEEV